MLLRTLKAALSESCYDEIVMQEKYGPYKGQMIVNLFNGYGISIIELKVTCPYFVIKADMVPIRFKDDSCIEWKATGDPVTNPDVSDFLRMIDIWSQKEAE